MWSRRRGYQATITRDHQRRLPDSGTPHAEVFLSRIGATVRHGGDKAFYSPEQDVIVLPKREHFDSLPHYYATSLHEHVHFTAHPSRLYRDLRGRFGDQSYAGEELIAELGSAFLCSKLEIPGELRHASYIASWLELLKEDSRAIFTAASAATKAADYLCSFSERRSRPTLWRRDVRSHHKSQSHTPRHCLGVLL